MNIKNYEQFKNEVLANLDSKVLDYAEKYLNYLEDGIDEGIGYHSIYKKYNENSIISKAYDNQKSVPDTVKEIKEYVATILINYFVVYCLQFLTDSLTTCAYEHLGILEVEKDLSKNKWGIGIYFNYDPLHGTLIIDYQTKDIIFVCYKIDDNYSHKEMFREQYSLLELESACIVVAEKAFPQHINYIKKQEDIISKSIDLKQVQEIIKELLEGYKNE